MERVYINRECGIAYTILAIHTIFYSANKEITLEALVKEIRVMFDVYTKEDKLLERMEEILTKEGKNKIIVSTGIEKIGMTIEECAAYLGGSERLVSELVKLPDFPCIKFKRRILINKLGINDWITKNTGEFLKY